jgi:hypothetical protein
MPRGGEALYAAGVVLVRCEAMCGQRLWIPTYVFGTTPAYLDVRDWRKLRSGNSFTDEDARSGAKTCLVGQTIVHELFEDTSPAGKTLRLHGVEFRVVGVLRSKGMNVMALDDDDVVLVPWTAFAALSPPAKVDPAKEKVLNTLEQLYPANDAELTDKRRQQMPRSLDQIVAAAKSVDDVPAASRQITALLRKRHLIAIGKPDDFHIRDVLEIMNALKRAAGE